MPQPFLLMALAYLALAGLMALDASGALFGLLPWHAGLVWLRVHFLTLGVLVEVTFGLLPGVVAARAGQPRPPTRWGVWLALNAGILVLVAGIPLVYAPAIAAGGTLVFIAAALLAAQLRGLPARPPAVAGRPFYLAGLAFLLLGIVAGTGLWLGWGEALRMAAAKEVHLHANLWGFTSLCLAGLLVDTYPRFAGRPLAWPRTVPAIFGLFVIGGLVLVTGPWLGITALAVPGLALHHLATALLLANVVQPLLREPAAWRPGLWHVVAGYGLILAPIALAPFVRLSGITPPMARISAGGPAFLVYAWVLQVVFALFPFVAGWLLPGSPPPTLGGNWLSLLGVNLGVGFFVAGMLAEAGAWLQGVGFLLWAGSLAAWAFGLWRAWQPRAASQRP